MGLNKNQFIVLLIAIVLMIIKESVAPNNKNAERKKIKECMNDISDPESWCGSYIDHNTFEESSNSGSYKSESPVMNCIVEIKESIPTKGRSVYCEAYKYDLIETVKDLKNNLRAFIEYIITKANDCTGGKFHPYIFC